MRSVLFVWLLLGWSFHSNAQVVVLAHPDSGDFVVVQNHPSSRAEATQRANARKRAGSWKLLLESAVPGYGAMFCFRQKGGDVRYFIAEGKVTGKEAITDARAQANTAASGGAFTALCGHWNNRNAYSLEAQASPLVIPQSSGAADGGNGPRKESESGLVETVKGEVRKRFECDRKRKPNSCPPEPKGTSIGVRG